MIDLTQIQITSLSHSLVKLQENNSNLLKSNNWLKGVIIIISLIGVTYIIYNNQKTKQNESKQ
jgi:hypothetical protein